MNSIVTDDANGIKGLLNKWVEPTLDQRRNVFIEVLSRLTDFLAKLLNGEPYQRGCSSG